MDSLRANKLNAIKGRKASNKILPTDGSKSFVDALDKRFKILANLFDDGIEVHADDLLKELEQINYLKENINDLNLSIKQLEVPELPKNIKIDGLSSLLAIIKRLDTKQLDLSPIKKVADNLEKLTKKIKDIKVPKQGQLPSDFIPTRRVMKVGNVLMYDDSFYTGGGGGSNIPTKNGAVPVVNPDGSNIGGGSGGLTDAQLRASPVPISYPDTVVTGTLTLVNDVVEIDIPPGYNSVGIALSGTFTGITVVPQEKVDNARGYDTCTMFTTAGSNALTSTAVAGTFQALVGGMTKFAVKLTAISTGSVNVTLRASRALTSVMLDNPLPSGSNTIGNVGINGGSNNIGSVNIRDTNGNTLSSSSNRLLVDGSGVTQPISGTVTATEAVYTTRIDAADSTTTYLGDADPGTATSAASWRIKKIDSNNPTSIKFAGGAATFVNIWDNRASLSYS